MSSAGSKDVTKPAPLLQTTVAAQHGASLADQLPTDKLLADTDAAAVSKQAPPQPEPARVADKTTTTATLKAPQAASKNKGWTRAPGEAENSSDDEEDGEAPGYEVVPRQASDDSDASSDDEDAKLNDLDADGKAEVPHLSMSNE